MLDILSFFFVVVDDNIIVINEKIGRLFRENFKVVDRKREEF